MPRGRAPNVGELFKLPDAARTLKLIAQTKGEAFYRGEIAAAAARQRSRRGRPSFAALVGVPSFNADASYDIILPFVLDAGFAGLQGEVAKLTAHLKAEDFLWAEKYPHATFQSTEVKAGGTDGFSHTVTGDLMIRGKTLRVSFPANITVSPTEVGANTEFVVDRKNFDVVYPGKADDLVQDNVVLKVNFVAPRA